MSLVKNQCVPLSITAVTSLGSGIGRYVDSDYPQGLVVFVPYTAVGDEIECRILKVEKQHAYGKVEKLLIPSPDRVEDPGCGVYGKCGGCAWRHVTYEAELRYKARQVEDCLRRIGGIEVTPDPIVGSERADRYRNKAQYPVTPGPHRLLIGFYAPRSHRVVEQRDCALQPPVFRDIVSIVARWMKQVGVPAYDEQTKEGLLRHIYIRQAERTGQLMVCLVCTSGKLPQPRLLIDALREIPGMTSIVCNLNAKDTNVVLGDREFVLFGEPAITDELCGLRFRLSSRSFYQVNRAQAEVLYRLAAEMAGLTGEETLLDLYCGTGTIGLSMARSAREVIGVEIVPQAVEDARRNADQNGIGNARFLCADAGEAARRLEEEGVRPDVVVLDPPRKGCGGDVIQAIGRLCPRRVVYVSCDPATLARDCRLLGERGYAVRRVTPVDLFPRTAHVETVALLERTETGGSA